MTTIGHRHTIVIIEDSRDERDALQLTLELEGYRVVALAGAREALCYLRGAESPASLIILDLMMRGTNGWEFRTEQLRDPRLALIPVVVCSGDGRLIEKTRALNLGDHLAKPIDHRALFELVARHCQNLEPPASTDARAPVLTP